MGQKCRIESVGGIFCHLSFLSSDLTPYTTPHIINTVAKEIIKNEEGKEENN